MWAFQICISEFSTLFAAAVLLLIVVDNTRSDVGTTTPNKVTGPKAHSNARQVIQPNFMHNAQCQCTASSNASPVESDISGSES
jgi:hypothetical protein